jgi:amphi-Trp domain-containing protein
VSDQLLKLKEKEHLPREQAAARLRAIANELESGNDVVFEQDGVRFVAKVPGHVELKLEFEAGEDESEFEIELSWSSPT